MKFVVCGYIWKTHNSIKLSNFKYRHDLIRDVLLTLKVASNKVVKHKKACSNNQHVLIPFFSNAFDFLAPRADDLLHRVQRLMNSKFVSLKSRKLILSSKGLVTQLVIHLSTIYV